MANPVDPEFRARLQALNDKFALTVPVTMGKIAGALAACEASVDGQGMPASDPLHQLHELLHGVAGSAATFGFPVLGQQARRIEQMVRAAMAENSGWAAIAPEVGQLLRWAAQDAAADNYNVS